MGVLTAERIKLTSTRSPWWCTAIIIVLGLGLPLLFTLITNATYGTENASEGPSLTPAMASSGIAGFGVMVLMIMAALAVTNEYRFGIIRTTFQATPHRGRVITTKAGLLAVYGAVLTGALVGLAYVLVKVIARAELAPNLELSGMDSWRPLFGVPIYGFLCVVLAVAIGTLVRQSAAAISLLILWPLLIEGLFGAIPWVAKNVTPYLPFANANHFLGSGGESTVSQFHWGPWGGLLYFAAFVAVVFGAALYSVNKRDA
ncbi:ABC transporter permease [Nocardia sp. XZ_19_385]|uniref:ABC transporter permease n=1 Tax=Nocardia sp. XZ_19_385 TaxID=2769488 RepID=UPI00188F74B5|nr:ABC transporter permease [Nocardia sp. XZ_19_385]